jgi:hypothetical protein
MEQEVLGRTNLLLSFDMIWTSHKTKKLGGAYTDSPLRRNDKGDTDSKIIS